MKYVTLGIYIFSLVVLSSFVVPSKMKTEVSYTSIVSSLTKIQLNLNQNGNFNLIINIFGDKIPETKSKGKWYERDGFYILTFKSRSSLALSALFPNNSLNTNIEVLNDETFKFKVGSIELVIFGIKCKKGSSKRV